MPGSTTGCRSLSRWSWLRLIFVCSFPLVLPPAVLRAADLSLEYQVKAAFLLNFTKFIEWPPDPAASDPAICLLGEDPFGPALDQMVGGESLQGRKLVVLRVRRPLPPACRVVFISRSEKDIPAVLQGLEPGILTVGEGPGFLQAGGVVDFVLENHRVRFDISQSAAAKAKLKISSKLLNVARSVEK